MRHRLPKAVFPRQSARATGSQAETSGNPPTGPQWEKGGHTAVHRQEDGLETDGRRPPGLHADTRIGPDHSGGEGGDELRPHHCVGTQVAAAGSPWRTRKARRFRDLPPTPRSGGADVERPQPTRRQPMRWPRRTQGKFLPFAGVSSLRACRYTSSCSWRTAKARTMSLMPSISAQIPAKTSRM
jgi:hypothetical protein